MITSKKLSSERIKEIKNFPIKYDKDSPKLTSEQIPRMKPIRSEYWKVEPVKVSVSRASCKSRLLRTYGSIALALAFSRLKATKMRF